MPVSDATHPPTVSVLIPTLRRLNYLKQAVQSVLDQTYPHCEAVISQDHGSAGLDAEVAAWSRSLAAENSRVRYSANARPMGLAGNWNASVAAASAEYVMLIGDDDRVLPEGIASLAEALSPRADIVFGNHYLIDHEGRRLEVESVQWTRRYGRDTLPPGLQLDAEKAVWNNSVPICAALIRRELLLKNRFNEALNTPEIELFLRLARAGAAFQFTPAYVSEYRIHPASATSSGLWLDKLLECLEPLEVRPELESHKAACLAGCSIGAAERLLLLGRAHEANAIAKSRYFPRGGIRAKALAVCAKLPAPMGKCIYRMLLWMRGRS